MTPPLFLVQPGSLVVGEVVIDGDEGHHAASVRRLAVGEALLVGDGCGHLGAGVVSAVDRRSVVVSVYGVTEFPLPLLRFVVVQALARGGRDEDAVEAMTEVGVDEIVGWSASRSVARWTDRSLAKWTATARSAVKQSRRPWLPVVAGPATTADVCALIAEAAVAVVLDGDASVPLSALAETLPAEGDVLLVVGPEGGVAPDELADFRSAGAEVARLGTGVLRSSTAGVAALSVLSAATRWR